MADNRARPLLLLLLLTTIGAAACGPRRLALPSGAGTPAADYAAVFAETRRPCEAVRTLQAELGLSGRAAGQRVRGRVLAGLVPAALRLEGVPPFGSPIFILVAEGASGTLLLPRDRRVVMDAPPEEILDALVGVRLGPDDLRALLAGCVRASGEPSAGRAYGDEWMAIDLAAGGTIYLKRDDEDDPWRIVAARDGELEIEYTEFAGARPSRIRLRGDGLDLALAVEQVEINADLPRDRLVAITIPPGVTPLPLDELRRGGPLGE